MPTTAIVVTTIFPPAWLSGYLDNLRKYGREAETAIIIIVDKKTPPEVLQAAAQAKVDGFDIHCPSCEEQQTWLDKLGAPAGFLPWNTDNRRNLGFLMAWEMGISVLISIDDDNYCPADVDFIGAHRIVGKPVRSMRNTAWVNDRQWFNICDMLQIESGDRIYPRGLPYAVRGQVAEPLSAYCDDRLINDNAEVAINAGLWTADPDVDAITRLAQGPNALSCPHDPIVLGPECWSPVNTQNTALTRDAMAAYYYVRMGFPVQGMRIDRYGDILSGYFVQKCAKHLGHGVRFGDPVAEHKRSPHNLFKDLYFELAGMVIVEQLLPWLQQLPLQGDDFRSSYASLADALRRDAGQFSGFVWDDGGQDFLRETADLMEQWLLLLAKLDNAGC